jgi:hypothetical protein
MFLVLLVLEGNSYATFRESKNVNKKQGSTANEVNFLHVLPLGTVNANAVTAMVIQRSNF